MKSTTKKLLLGILLTVCLTVLLALCAGAEDVTYSEGLKFTSNGDGTCSVSGIGTCTDTEIVIPPVSPDGDVVTEIREYAFGGCQNLTSVTIPNSVTKIGMNAFGYCQNLTSVVLPEGVTEIGDYVFADCYSLTSITIPESVTYLGSGVWHNCSAVEMISFNARLLTGYSENCLSNVGTNGTGVKVKIGNNVTKIPSKLFTANCKVVSVEFEDGSVCKTIDYYAFYNCTDLKSITIPESVTSIGSYAFRGCTSLEKICFNAMAMNDLTSSFNSFYDAGSKGNGIKVVIGQNVTNIPSYLFQAGITPKIISIEFEEGSGCESIGDYAFYSCKELTSISLPDGITSIGDYAFALCKGVTSISIPDSITSIGETAFYYCLGLTSITIPERVVSIGDDAFRDCTGLEEIFFNAREMDDLSNSNEVFNNAGKNSLGIKVVIGKNVTKIPSYLFGAYSGDRSSYAPKIVSIEFRDGSICESIGNHAFDNCTGLMSFVIPEGVISIGDSAFRDCSNLTNITIPDSITSIGNSAFYKCVGLTSITIPDKVTAIEMNTFLGCKGLTSITIPENVTSIGISAFRGCNSLTSVIIPASVTSVQRSAFYSTSLIDVFFFGMEDEWNKITIGSSNEVLLNATIHFLGDAEVVSNTATCTEPGGITYACGCGSTHTFEKAALGHDMGEWKTTVDPTCMTQGEERRDCQRDGCDHYESKPIEIDPTAHSLEWTYDGDQHWQYCTNKNKEGVQCTHTTEKADHIPGEWITDPGKEATCIADGEKHTECTVCGAHMPEIISALGHNRGEDGYCTRCGEIMYSKGLEFTSNGDGTCYVSGIGTCTDRVVHIPPVSPAGDRVTSIGDRAFWHCSSLTSITIPDGVTSIGDSAFSDCSSLESITIGNGVTSIGNYAFYYCESLTSITIPDAVTSIGNSAFNKCSSLASVSIGDGVTSIGHFAFRYCSSLESVTIGNSVTSIGYEAFYGCSGLTGITIPDSVTSIGDYAFRYCSSLESVTIGNGVTSIGHMMFYGCSGLTSITIPDGVTSIGDYAFYGCSSLESVTIGNGVTSIGYAAFSDCSSLTSISIPNSVTSIGHYAFSDCSSLASVTIGNGVTSIGSGAFCGCSSLTSITIPNGVTSIGRTAFAACSGLTGITIPNSVISIGDYAFQYCSSLASVTIGNGVTSIGNSAFEDCSGLTSITVEDGNPVYQSAGNCIIRTADKVLIAGCQTSVIPTDGSVTGIGDRAFYNCSGLTGITIPDSVTSIGNSSFQYCSGLESVTIGNGVTSIGDSAFSDCSSLESVTIGNSVTSIGSYAFFDCSSLASVTIGNSVTSIGEGAFYGCSSLTSITIPNSVTSIGHYAFYECSGLTGITIPDSVTSIGRYAFYGCDNLFEYEDGVTYVDKWVIDCDVSVQKVVLRPGTKGIADYAFSGCSNLLSITIPDSVTSIGSCAFLGCSSLTSITIPDSVTNIGSDAFGGCSSLTSITIPDSVTSISSGAFGRCSSLTSITIPDSVTSIGDWAFYDCSGLTEVYYSGTESQWESISIDGYNSALTNATIHFLGDAEIISNTATCTEAGEVMYECGCGSTHTFEQAALGHDEIPHDAQAPTCENIGWDAYVTCSRCPYTTYEAIPTTDHSFIKYAYDSANHWFVCEDCGAEPEIPDKKSHEFTWTVTDNTNEDEDKLSCTLRGQCACGYGKVEPIITGTAKITGASLALGEKLTLKYYATLPAANMNVVIRFTYEGETYDVIGVKDEKSGEYVFSFDRIPPSKMDTIVKAELILINEDGSETVLAVKEEYSITQYCEDAKQDNLDNSALNHLLNDLENYSKAAEDYENGVSKDPSDVVWEPLTDTDFSLTDPADETVRFISAGVRFGYINRLFFKFTADDLNSLTVKVNDTLYTAADFALVEGTENTYIIYSEGINATEFDKIFTAVLLVNGEEVQTLEYSVKSYVEAKQDDPEIGALVRSLYNYGKSSELYRDEM